MSNQLAFDTVQEQPQDLTLVMLAVAGRQAVCVAGEPFTNHLAVTPALATTPPDEAVRYAGDTWTVTHRLSGMAVCHITGPIQQSRVAAHILADCADWTRPIAELAADPHVRAAIIAAISNGDSRPPVVAGRKTPTGARRTR